MFFDLNRIYTLRYDVAPFFSDLFYADKTSSVKNPSGVCGTITLYCDKRS